MERVTDLTLWRLRPHASCPCRGHVVITLGPGDAEPAGPITCPTCGCLARRLYVLIDTSGWPPITEAELAALGPVSVAERGLGTL
jgi:hypothetical protein